MNYEEARVYLDNVAKYGSVLGLDAMREFFETPWESRKGIEDHPHRGDQRKRFCSGLPVHGAHGERIPVGRYISPTLFSYRERIQVDGAYIEKEPLARLVTKIREASESMDRDGLRTPTAFEIETALGLLYFAEKKCDAVVLETGMGGRDDATNAIEEVLMEVFASISLDHLGVLGNNLREIAECKADIIRRNTLVISDFQKEEAAEVLRRTAAERNAKLIMVDPGKISDVRYGVEEQSFSYGEEKDIRIHLAGAYQIENAALATEAVQGLRSLGFAISGDAFRRGMKKTVWRGRFTCIHKNPLVFMDGAHNEDAAKKLAASIETYFPGKKLFYIMGVFKDKEYEKVIRITAPYAARVTAVETPGNPRALPREELKKAWEVHHVPVMTADSIEQAVKENIETAGKDEVILIFGSLSFLGEAEKAVKELG